MIEAVRRWITKIVIAKWAAFAIGDNGVARTLPIPACRSTRILIKCLAARRYRRGQARIIVILARAEGVKVGHVRREFSIGSGIFRPFLRKTFVQMWALACAGINASTVRHARECHQRGRQSQKIAGQPNQDDHAKFELFFFMHGHEANLVPDR